MAHSNFYRCFDLGIRSEIGLPELAAGPDGPMQLEIARSRVAEELGDVTKAGVCYQAAENRLLLKIGGVARYLVEDGRRILVESEPGADDADVRVFLLGSAFGAALHQRGDLVLHGSAIRGRAGGVGFLGISGIGKSTLAMAFHRRGHGVLADDLCVVRAGLKDRWAIQPGIPRGKLWADSLDRLSIRFEDLPRVRNKLNKRFVPLSGAASAEARHFYVLRISNDGTCRIERLAGVRKLAALRDYTYRPQFVEGMGGSKRHFEQVMALARQVEVSEVWRPAHGFRLDELVDLLESDFPA